MAIFDDIKHVDKQGNEFWDARELMQVLKYASWQKFKEVIDKAIESCEANNINASEAFTLEVKRIKAGRGISKQEDYKLTRGACYLIAMNGSPRKKSIAEAQLYFATKTRKAELIEELNNDENRIQLRDKLRLQESEFSSTLYFDANITNGKDIGRIRSAGDKGLLGKITKELRAEIGCKGTPNDYLHDTVLMCKSLQEVITTQKIKTNKLNEVSVISKTHYNNGKSLNEFMFQQGIKLEELPYKEDVKKIARKNKNTKKLLS